MDGELTRIGLACRGTVPKPPPELLLPAPLVVTGETLPARQEGLYSCDR